MAGLEIEVQGAEFRGNDDSFTIYGVDVFEDEECRMEARVVISGTRDEQTGDLTGSLALEYPGTGAEFSYTASRLNCDANLQAAQTFVQSAEARACSTDADCVAEGIGCAELQGAFCGDIALSVDAALSDEWDALENGLRACSADTCVVCDALLVPTCESGLCQ